jgi:hypothetical protein
MARTNCVITEFRYKNKFKKQGETSFFIQFNMELESQV